MRAVYSGPITGTTVTLGGLTHTTTNGWWRFGEVRFDGLSIRGNDSVGGASVWVSSDGLTYSLAGTIDGWSAGGLLQSALSKNEPYIVEHGPTMTTYNADITDVLDLSSDEFSWRNASQIAFIGGEIFWLRNLTAVGPLWRLDGLIRARYDTSPADHAIGDNVIILNINDVEPVFTQLLKSDASFSVKIQPTSDTSAVDLSLLTAITITTQSLRALRPLPPENFYCNRDGDRVNEYSSGGDAVFTWNYRVKDGQGSTADERGAGIPIGATDPHHEGQFRVEIYSLGILKRTLPLIDSDSATATYSNAHIIADFISEPASFDAVLTNINGSYESISRTITVNKN